MKEKFEVKAIGKVHIENSTYSIKIKKEYTDGLKNIEGFSHLQIVWWGHLTDSIKQKELLVKDKLFKKGPDRLGVFATRSPERPNPILISTVKVKSIDFENGIIYVSFIDAETQSPVLDVKPYFLMERVKNCSSPEWTARWPKWWEEVSIFNWTDEINI